MSKLCNLLLLQRSILLVLAFCGAFQSAQAQDPASPSVYQVGNRNIGSHADSYLDTIQPILTKRCVSCHSCTSGPCQLNLTSYEGLVRGLSKVNPHDINRRFKAVERAKLSDHLPLATWRKQGFYPIINQSKVRSENENSILYLALTLGDSQNSMTNEDVRREGLRQESEQYQCPVNPQEYRTYAASFPQGGMPLACPGMDAQDVETLKEWVLNGAPGPSAQAQKNLSLPQATAATLDANFTAYHALEDFLNRDTLKAQTIARYIYEHAFSIDIHFAENPGEFFRIVRSRSKAPAAIDLIVTEFPSDAPSPESGRIYYRLEKLDRAIEMKKHVTWAMDLVEIAKLDSIFNSTAWDVKKLSSYPKNPFEWFSAIPASIRATYVVQYARLIWHSVARGAICHSREASYIEPDYAWYLMLKPESDPTVQDATLGFANYEKFFAHAEEGIPRMVTLQYHKEPQAYADAFEKVLRRIKPNGLGIDDIEPNFFYGLRHETSYEFHSASDTVVPGYPKIKRLLSYADTERYYYRTVVQYRYYGSTLEKAEAFTFAGYIRGYAENLFASLSPDPKEREALMAFTTDALGRRYYGFDKDHSKGRPSQVPAGWSYETISRTLLARARALSSTNRDDLLNNWPNTNLPKTVDEQITQIDQWDAAVRTLTGKEAAYVQYLPNNIHIRLDGKHLYTFFVERGYTLDRIPGKQAAARRPLEDRLFAMKGFTGAFPHLFVDLKFADAAVFINEISQIKTVNDWVAFDRKFGIDRVDQEFWPFYDWLHLWMSENLGADAGILDLRNYDLRDKPY